MMRPAILKNNIGEMGFIEKAEGNYCLKCSMNKSGVLCSMTNKLRAAETSTSMKFLCASEPKPRWKALRASFQNVPYGMKVIIHPIPHLIFSVAFLWDSRGSNLQIDGKDVVGTACITS